MDSPLPGVGFNLQNGLSAWRADLKHAHHFVILVGQNVAVSDVAAWFVEGRLDPRNLVGQRGHHVFGCILDVLGHLPDSPAVGEIHDAEAPRVRRVFAIQS